MLPEKTYLEAKSREVIDQKLISAGWLLLDIKRLKLMESFDVAAREVFGESNHFAKKITKKAGRKRIEATA